MKSKFNSFSAFLRRQQLPLRLPHPATVGDALEAIVSALEAATPDDLEPYVAALGRDLAGHPVDRDEVRETVAESVCCYLLRRLDVRDRLMVEWI